MSGRVLRGMRERTRKLAAGFGTERGSLGLMRGVRMVFACCALLAGFAACADPSPPDAVELGRRIYREGLGADGAPIAAGQNGALSLRGEEAACIRCHRSSGMGSVEGELRVSPISGRYLFPVAGDLTMAMQDGHVGKAVSKRHEPYTLEKFDRALRQGVNILDRPLSALMPHYAFSPSELAGLQAYLSTLSVTFSPGAETKVIHFATIITPDVSPERRLVFRQMLEAAVRSKNASTAPQRRYMAPAAVMVTRSDRKWQLEFWELTGPPEEWPAQLDAHYAKAPPFAILSGLGGQTWQPVHAFCDQHALPCWFPSVTVPGDSASSSYNFYFHDGVALEAQVLAQVLSEGAAGVQSQSPVVQIRDGSPAAEAGARALRAALQVQGRTADERVVTHLDAAMLTQAYRKVPPGAAVMLWLSDWPADLVLPGTGPVYLSAGLLGERYRTIPAAMRTRVQLVYPYALPSERQANLAYMQTWLKLQQIPLVDEVMQSEVFFSLNFMTDVVQDMLDNLYRDYLIERAEDMLSRRESGKAEQESRDRATLGRTAREAVNRAALHNTVQNMRVSDAPDMHMASELAFGYKDSGGTTVYPRLSLGPHQRYASKGASIAGFAGNDSDTLVVRHPWTVP